MNIPKKKSTKKGFTMLTDEVLGDEKFSATDKILYSWLYRKTIGNKFNKHGYLTYSNKKLSETVKESVHTVQRCLTKLKKAQKIRITYGEDQVETNPHLGSRKILVNRWG